MIEKIFNMKTGNEKTIEKLIWDENIHYNHMILPKNEGLPEHYSNSTVYMTIVRGKLSIQLNDNEEHYYNTGTVLKIPYNVKMNVNNKNEEILELIVVKAPAPQK